MSFSIHSLSLTQRAEVVERSHDVIGRHTGPGILTMLEAVDIAREEMVAEHRDTIKVCEVYIADAKEYAGSLHFLFPYESVEFAHGQIAFEKAAVALLEGGTS